MIALLKKIKEEKKVMEKEIKEIKGEIYKAEVWRSREQIKKEK